MAIIVKNTTASGISINDLAGITIDSYGQVDLREFFSLDDINYSNNLKTFINDEILILNDGTKDLTKEESIEQVDIYTVYEAPKYFKDLYDTPTTLSGNRLKIVRVNENEDSLEFSNTSNIINEYKSMLWTNNPTYNGIIRVVGWYYSTDLDYNLYSGSIFTPLEDGYNSFFSFNIKSGSSFPFTLNISGTLVNEQPITPTYYVSNENITITGTGYYRTLNNYLDKPDIYIVESNKSCIFDVYKFYTWDACGVDIHIVGAGSEFVPDQNNWNLYSNVYKIEQNGSKTLLCSFDYSNNDTVRRAGDSKPGVSRKQLDCNMYGSLGEGIVISTDQDSIGSFCILINYK